MNKIDDDGFDGVDDESTENDASLPRNGNGRVPSGSDGGRQRERNRSIKMVTAYKLGKDGPAEAATYLDKPDILYAFIAREDLSQILQAPWIAGARGKLQVGKVYARTEDGLYLTEIAALRGLPARLGERWTSVSQSAVFNLARLRWADFKSRNKCLGVSIRGDARSQGGTEAVTISVRSWRRVRREIAAHL